MSIESKINQQYEEVFRQDDWSSFKCASDYYFENASKLLTKDIQYQNDTLKLLFRNIQKRLFLGIGTELLLKAIFLKHGYMINKRDVKNIPKGNPPFLINEVDSKYFSKSKTLTFNDLIQKLSRVQEFDKNKVKIINKGLRIAKVFRNKEGHVILVSHEYVAKNYRDIEDCLKLLYFEVFNQTLTISVAFSKNETGSFKIKKGKNTQ